MKYVIIEQAEDNEGLITRDLSKEDANNYQSLEGGDFIILSESAFSNMCGAYCIGKWMKNLKKTSKKKNYADKRE